MTPDRRNDITRNCLARSHAVASWQRFEVSPHDDTSQREEMPRLTEAELDAHIAERMAPLPPYDVERESPRLYLLIALVAVLAGAFAPIVYDWIRACAL